MCDMVSQLIQKKEKEKKIEEAQAANARYWKIPAFYDDDDNYTFAITPNNPVNSLSMGDEHPDTVPATVSDEFIKFSVENLVLIPSESEGIPDNMCDVPFHDNSLPLDVSKDQFEDFSDSNDEFSSIDDDSFSIDNIDYVEASPPDYELVSSEVMEIVIPKVGGIDNDIILTIKDDILREKLLNVNLLIAKIEALNDNPTPSSDFLTKSSSTSLNSLLEETNNFDNSLPESDFNEFADELIHIISRPEYDCFLFEIEPNSGDFTMDVVEDISPTREPRVHNALPTHPTLQLNLKFQPSSESLFTYVVWIFLPFLVYLVAPHYLLSLRNEDTIFDPGIWDFTMDVVEDISPTREPRVHNALPTHPTLQLNLKFQPSRKCLDMVELLHEGCWTGCCLCNDMGGLEKDDYKMFLEEAEKVERPDVSHRSGTFPSFKVLNESPMEILSSTCSPMDQ
nr:hypothetical protein [Tanacetum cinerariifolium]